MVLMSFLLKNTYRSIKKVQLEIINFMLYKLRIDSVNILHKECLQVIGLDNLFHCFSNLFQVKYVISIIHASFKTILLFLFVVFIFMFDLIPYFSIYPTYCPLNWSYRILTIFILMYCCNASCFQFFVYIFTIIAFLPTRRLYNCIVPYFYSYVLSAPGPWNFYF